MFVTPGLSLRPAAVVALLVLATANVAVAIQWNSSSVESIKSVSSVLAYDLMSIYRGNYSGGTPGQLPSSPYYWWESGGLWAVMINYWFATNDTVYNDVVMEGLLYQVGPNADYMPPNQTMGMGNDDQGFWGMAAMTAAELAFPNPPPSSPQWLSLAQAVFNEFASRFQVEIGEEAGTCGGGLRWQVYFFNDGWNYKNSISNGCMFNLGARLARYTGNDTYAKWAVTTWDWITRVGLMELQPYSTASRNFSFDGKGAGGYVVWDGVTVQSNCHGVNGIPYSYNAGYWLLGAATMYNYTNASAVWESRTQLLLNATLNIFFPNGTAYEPTCEPTKTCNTDMLSFKAYLIRCLATTTQLAPFTRPLIQPFLRISAEAAMKQCTGGASSTLCGYSWALGNGSANATGSWDGTTGAGQQMAALEVVLANMIQAVGAPLTASTGGTSKGDPAAGAKPRAKPSLLYFPPTRGSKAGAALLTMLVVTCMLVFVGVICADEKWPDVKTEDLEGRVQTPSASSGNIEGEGAGKGKRVSETSSSSDGYGEKEKESVVWFVDEVKALDIAENGDRRRISKTSSTSHNSEKEKKGVLWSVEEVSSIKSDR